MNLDDVREILALMRENGLSEFEIEHEGLRLRLRKDATTGAPALAGAPAVPAGLSGAVVSPVAGSGAAPAGPVAAGEADVELAVVKSPIVGTFYRSPEPGAASFVEIGSTVKRARCSASSKR